MTNDEAKEITDKLDEILGRLDTPDNGTDWPLVVSVISVAAVCIAFLIVVAVANATPPDQPPAEPTEQCDPWSVEPGQPVPEGCKW